MTAFFVLQNEEDEKNLTPGPIAPDIEPQSGGVSIVVAPKPPRKEFDPTQPFCIACGKMVSSRYLVCATCQDIRHAKVNFAEQGSNKNAGESSDENFVIIRKTTPEDLHLWAMTANQQDDSDEECDGDCDRCSCENCE